MVRGHMCEVGAGGESIQGGGGKRGKRGGMAGKILHTLSSR